MADAVYVVGASGHAKVVISTLRAAGHEVLGAFDDDPCKEGQTILGVPVLGAVARLRGRAGARAVIAIGDNRVRKSMVELLPDVAWVTIVHPGAYVHASARLGTGTVVFAGAIVQPDVVVGRHAIVNTAASVDHDCQLADFAQVAPGVRLGGGVEAAEGVMIGIGATVIQKIRIGAWSVVGAGAVVIRDLPAGVTAVGVPSRVIKTV